MADTNKPPTENPKQTSNEAGQAEVQKKMDEATSKGFHGSKVDPTPNEHYTVPGVLAGKPTPETDNEHAAKVAEHVRNLPTP